MSKTISRTIINSALALLQTLSTATQKSVLKNIRNIGYADIADLREQLIAILEPFFGAAVEIAVNYALDYYNQIRYSETETILEYASVSGRNSEATEKFIRALIKKVDEGHTIEDLFSKILDRVDYEIKQAFNVAVAEYSEQDQLKPKWARVTSGTETCSFCLMLSSFGFQYNSEKTAASHTHANCDCMIVPSFNGATIEGYDADAMYKSFLSLREKLGGREQLLDDFETQLTDEERTKRIAKYGGKKADAQQAYINQRISKAIGELGRDKYLANDFTQEEVDAIK